MAETLVEQLAKMDGAGPAQYKGVLDEWRQRNIVINEVIAGQTTFLDEAKRVLEGAGPKWRTEWYEAKTDRDKALEECIAPFKKVDFWYDVALGASGTAAVVAAISLITGSNMARTPPERLTENQKWLIQSTISTSPQPITSRRDFVLAYALKAATCFLFIGGIGGCGKNLYDRANYAGMAQFLDNKVKEAYR